MKNEELLNKKCYEDTKQILSNYKIIPSIKLTVSQIINNDYDYNYKYDNIQVLDIDCIELCIKLNKELLLLNMANAKIPGGCYNMDGNTQEEAIFRNTTASATLLKEYYPLKDDEYIYSPNILIIKNNKLIDKPINMSMITIAAMVHSSNKKPFKKYEREIMIKKINEIFVCAINNNIKILVLGAFGCGAFNCPVDEVVDIFKDRLKVYGNKFDMIYFAISKNYDLYNYFYSHIL